MRVLRGTLLTVLLGVAACDDSTAPPRAANVTTVTGLPTTVVAGSTNNISVRVTSTNGTAVPNVPVTFAVTGGGGEVAPASVTTNANGEASTIWILGRTPGTNTLTATAAGVTTPITFTANATAGRVASIAVQAGDATSAPAGGAVTTRPSVVVRDALGNPVAGANVFFSVESGGGTVTGQQQVTDASGVATVGGVTLGRTSGNNVITALVLESNVTGNPVRFNITGTAGAAASLGQLQGNVLTGTAGTAAAVRPGIVVTDANGNPVANVPVTFTVTSGGGTITGGTQTTNGLGVATVGGFTFGQTAGPNVITVSAPGVAPLTLTLTGTAGPAASAVAQAGNNQQASIGATVATAPSVLVRDAFGNPVAGVTVNFSVASGGGSVTGAQATTNAQGIATVGSFRVGNTLGVNTVVARVAGLPDVTFTATATAGAPASITAAAGDQQTAVSGSTAPIAPTVVVRDAAGNPVQGAAVTFAVASGGGTVTGATRLTDANGRASVGSFVLGATAGVNTVTASVAGLQPVVFTITGTQAPAATVAILAGNNQTGFVGTALGVNPSVVVRDANGNPVPGVPVFFGISAGGGAVQNVNVLTDALGIATPGAWVLGPNPGTNILSAIVSAPNVVPNPVQFTATGVNAPVGITAAVVAGDNQTARVGFAVPIAPSVIVRDANNVPLAGVAVTFAIQTGGGALTGATQVTDANGVATVGAWQLGSIGANTLIATVAGGAATAAFNATGTP